MKKLNNKQLMGLTNGKHYNGNGLYINLIEQRRGKWSFRYRINQKYREMGLGKFPDVSLAEARQRALNNKQLLGHKIDPIDEKNRAKITARRNPGE